RYTVEETLAGRAEELKEITLGAAVYDRPADYDPRVDPIVRVEARRLRTKLSQYYENDGRDDAIVIELPLGGYAPEIRERTVPSLAPGSRLRFTRTTRVAGALALTVLVGIGITALVGNRSVALRDRDFILLGEFANNTGDTVFDFTLREGLAAKLSQS